MIETHRPFALASLALIAAASLPACSDGDKPNPPPALTSRNEAVSAPSGKTGATGAASAAPTTSSPSPKSAPRDVCAGQKERPGPKGTVKTKAAAGASALPSTIAFGAGKWVWLNFWAAWCGPCKEEMPRLVAWQEKLRKAGVLIDFAFVSLDDDERQLERFLEGQPPSGVRASYWLPEGGTRTSFLASIGAKDTPELPLQALVSPGGQLACTVQGAVEDRDYEAIAAFVGAKK
jgi:thiol-disulfide isomerase/thioredoxin